MREREKQKPQNNDENADCKTDVSDTIDGHKST